MAATVFDRQDLISPIWIRLREYLELELAVLRERNDGQSLTDVETATIRGEIKRIKTLLRLGNPEPEKRPS